MHAPRPVHGDRDGLGPYALDREAVHTEAQLLEATLALPRRRDGDELAQDRRVVDPAVEETHREAVALRARGGVAHVGAPLALRREVGQVQHRLLADLERREAQSPRVRHEVRANLVESRGQAAAPAGVAEVTQDRDALRGRTDRFAAGHGYAVGHRVRHNALSVGAPTVGFVVGQGEGAERGAPVPPQRLPDARPLTALACPRQGRAQSQDERVEQRDTADERHGGHEPGRLGRQRTVGEIGGGAERDERRESRG